MESTRNLRIASRSTLFAVLMLALFLSLPIWSYSSSWGSYPSLAIVALILIVGLLLFRVTPRNL